MTVVDNRQWAALEALAEPRRREVFGFVAAQPGPVSRDDVAAGLGMNRPLAAHHLDRLVDAGLLTATFARPPGRGGPGAGRPAKRYAAAEPEVSVSVPPRRYDVAARIFARALTGAAEPREAVPAIAAEEGRAVGLAHGSGGPLGIEATLSRSAHLLERLGYVPERSRRCIRLRNCPFHGVLDVAPELMCTANHAFLTGVLEGLGGSERVTAVLDPPAGPDCCVQLRSG
ncbi:MAG: transcriptional regulator [Mycobacterium sp.]|nr:transcriptional regulator [Mycobacterium sp.]